MADPIQNILARVDGARKTANGWQARCPAHDDRHASLCIATGTDGAALLCCQAKCPTEKVVAALGLKMTDLFASSNGNGRHESRASVTATYDYRDGEGVLLCQAVRLAPKAFFQRRPDGKGGWINNLDGVQRVLYRLPELMNHRDDKPDDWVFVPEGEKDVDRLRALGLTATTNIGGAGKWRAEYGADLAGLRVAVLPDFDKAGDDHAVTVAKCLEGKAAVVRVVRLPGLPPKGDVSDFLDAGGTVEKLVELAETAATSTAAVSASPAASSLPDDVDVTVRPILTRLSDVTPQPVEWLWPGRIAIGKITLVIGDPGLGKSFLSCDLAARVSAGKAWPDDVFGDQRPVGDVVLLNAEDGLADTIRHRLDSAGADVSRIVAIEGVEMPDPETNKPRVYAFNIARDTERLEEALQQNPETKLVVIDPISAYLGKTDSHSNAEVRGLLVPLAKLAEKYRVAMVLISHMNKSGGGKAVYRTNGSLAFPAASRAAWLVARDQLDDERRLFLPVKNNLAKDAGGLAFRIDDAGRIVWEAGAVMMAADDVLGDGENPGKRDTAEMWLAEYLKTGPKLVKEIEAEAESAGVAKRTLRRAMKGLGVRTQKAGFGVGWTWSLPTPAHEVGQGGHVRPASESWPPSGEVGHLREITAKNDSYAHTLPPRGSEGVQF